MTQYERADKLLALREDLYEMHFHEVDRKWLIEAMVDFAQQLPQQEISDEEIEKAAIKYNEELKKYVGEDDYKKYVASFIYGAKWYREQLKQKQ